MIIEHFYNNDIGHFLELAYAEGWVAEAWELSFILLNFPSGCFSARDETGTAVGFVTSFKHDRSGWIGNLIVADGQRGKGVGEALFAYALQALRTAGAETVWLTASKKGRSLYEKHGFLAIDTIHRWTGFGRQLHNGHKPDAECTVTTISASDIDNQTWGDRRDVLLAATIGRGKLLLKKSGFLVIQPCGDAMQFGPFSALDNGTAEDIFNAALRMVPPGTKVYLDAPTSNHAAMRLFSRKQMQNVGTNELMYAGKRPEYRSEFLFGLATMGSCG